MAKSPLLEAAEQLATFSLDELKQYCAENPSIITECKTCHQEIASTPWWSERTRSFHINSEGWAHTATNSSSCGRDYPYKSAHPVDG